MDTPYTVVTAPTLHTDEHRAYFQTHLTPTVPVFKRNGKNFYYQPDFLPTFVAQFLENFRKLSFRLLLHAKITLFVFE